MVPAAHVAPSVAHWHSPAAEQLPEQQSVAFMQEWLTAAQAHVPPEQLPEQHSLPAWQTA